MVKGKLNNRGFTFVELILAVAILSIVMISIVHFMTTTSTVYSRSNRDNEVQSQAQDVYQMISSCLMQANTVILYGYAKDASTGSYEAVAKYYVSDGMEVVCDKAARMHNTSGVLCNAKEKELRYLIPCRTGIGSGGTSISTIYNTAVYGFQWLKQDSGGTEELTEVKVEDLYMEYQTKVGSGYETCYLTVHYDDVDGKLYLNRHYISEPACAASLGMTAAGRLKVYMDSTELEENLLCQTLGADGFLVVVYDENDSIGLNMDFDNYKMTYDSQGMIKIRNKNTLMR